MIPRYLTWKEFVGKVKTLLTTDKERLGLEDDNDGTPGYNTLMIRQAVLDLQEFIPAYQVNQESIYLPSDFAPEGSALRGALPPLTKFREAFVFDSGDGLAVPAARFPLNYFPWEHRFELINNLVPIIDSNGKVAVDEQAYTFYIYPALTDTQVVSLWWDGKKIDFNDADEVPFPEEAAQAVADYVKGRIARDVDHDVGLYNSYFHPTQGTYVLARRKLFLNAQARRNVR